MQRSLISCQSSLCFKCWKLSFQAGGLTSNPKWSLLVVSGSLGVESIEWVVLLLATCASVGANQRILGSLQDLPCGDAQSLRFDRCHSNSGYYWLTETWVKVKSRFRLLNVLWSQTSGKEAEEWWERSAFPVCSVLGSMLGDVWSAVVCFTVTKGRQKETATCFIHSPNWREELVLEKRLWREKMQANTRLTMRQRATARRFWGEKWRKTRGGWRGERIEERELSQIECVCLGWY